MAQSSKTITHMLSSMPGIRDRRLYLMLTLQEEGLAIHRFSYNTRTKKMSESRSFFLRNLYEKNLSQSRVLRSILKIIYFPFQYRLLLNLPHQFCQSRYELTTHKREKIKETIGPQELNSFLTHTVWKLVEKNKKLFIASRKYDDLNTLLAQNALVRAYADNEDIRSKPEDTIASLAPGSIQVGIAQTHVYRPLFLELSKMLPKRVVIQSVLENGFSIAASMQTKEPKLIFIVERNRTNVFKSEPQEIAHVGYFNFGTQSMYETCNNRLGIGKEAYQSVLQRFIRDDLSVHARKYIEKIVQDELSRLQKGIVSFKKELRIQQAFIEAGVLNYFLLQNKKFPAQNIPHEHADHDILTQTSLEYARMLEEKSYMRRLMQKLFRWLMPNIID